MNGIAKFIIGFVLGSAVTGGATYYCVNKKWANSTKELIDECEKLINYISNNKSEEPEVMFNKPVEDIDKESYEEMSDNNIPTDVVITKPQVESISARDKFNARMEKKRVESETLPDTDPRENRILDSLTKYNSYFRQQELEETIYNETTPADSEDIHWISGALFDYAIGHIPGERDTKFVFPDDIPQDELSYMSDADGGYYKDYTPIHLVYFKDGIVRDVDDDCDMPHPDAYLGENWEDMFDSVDYDSGVFGYIFCLNDMIQRSFAIEIIDMTYDDYIKTSEEEGGERD